MRRKCRPLLINSWMPVQQIVYHMLRYFIKTEQLTDCADNSGACTLSNYHIKTLMLWACELKPRSWWTDDVNLVKMCVQLLHILVEWLTDARCQHYFIDIEAQSRLGGARHFCPKIMYEKLTEFRNFPWYLPPKLSKFPNFIILAQKQWTKFPNYTWYLPEKCPNFTWKLPEKYFRIFFLGGEGTFPHWGESSPLICAHDFITPRTLHAQRSEEVHDIKYIHRV